LDSGLGSQGGGNSEERNAMRNAMRSKSENIERINDLANNEDSNVSSKVVQNNAINLFEEINPSLDFSYLTNGAIETDLNLQGAPTSKIGICKHCGELFEKRTTWHVFCVEQCRLDYHGVQDIGGLKVRNRKR
jgi:hypothetical protein